MNILDPIIALGIKEVQGKQYWVELAWNNSNGILIAGQSGSGKSQTAAFYLNQYAYQGTKFIICDFESPDEDEESLSERIKHLEQAFYLPVAKTQADIEQRLHALNEEYQLRKKDRNRRFPLILVIDEVSAFLSYMKEQDSEHDPIERFARDLLLMRKVGIRAMIIGQEWSSGFSSQVMRPIRSAFKVRVVHRLDSANVRMVLSSPTPAQVRAINQLKVGEAFVDDIKIYIPLLSAHDKDRAREIVTKTNWTPAFEQDFMDMLQKHTIKHTTKHTT